jgi:hypothetical protein
MNFNDIRDKLHNQYAKNTVNSYFSSFRKIIRNAFNKEMSNITLDELKDTNKIFDYLDTINNLSVQKVLLNGLIKIIYHLDLPMTLKNKLDNKLDEIQKKENEIREYAKPSEKEMNQKFDYNIISTKLDTLKKKLKYKKHQNITNCIKYIMLTALKYLPPLRNEDYGTTRILTTDKKKYKDNNRLILKAKKWIIEDFKTKKTINNREFDVPDQLIEAIKFTLKIYPKYSYVFPKVTDITKPASTVSITNFLSRLLGAGVQTLRKIYISDMIDKGVNANERKRVAKIMGHSARQAMFNYTKFSDVLHGNNKELNEAIYHFKKLYGKKKLLEIINEAYEEMEKEE